MVKKTISSIRSILTREQNEILSAAAMLMVLLFATKIVGMVFLSLVSSQFGASADLDLFYLASAVPETITNIILLGAISGSIIPVLVKIKEKEGDEKFSSSFSTIMNLGMLLFVFLSVLVMIFAKFTVPFAVEITQRSGDLSPDDIENVISMTRILLIPQIILGASAFLSSGLNIHHRFIIPQLAPLLYNLGKIIGIIFLIPIVDDKIWALVWGTLIGAVLHLLIQIPLWRELKIGYRFLYVNLRDKNFVEAMKLGLPRVLGLSVEEVARIADTLISFSLTVGSLASYQYALRLTAIPLNLFGTSYAIASFPSLSRLWSNGSKIEFEILVRKIINQVLFLALPVSGLFIILRVPIVRLVYGILGGSFTWADTLQVSWVLMFFAIGISLETLRTTLFRVYFAIHNSIVPLISSVFVLIFGVITGILLTNYFSNFYEFSILKITFNPSYFFNRSDGPLAVGGLALSSSLVFSAEFFLLLFILRYKKVITNLRGLGKEMIIKLFATLVMMTSAYTMAKVWEGILQTDKTVQLILLTATTALTAFGIYLITCKLLRIEEVNVFMRFIVRTFKKLSFFKV
ncbi:MAG TPA: lipid II flippase MurJ [Candidatus Dojkabacteria bacterium]|nr:lipid II flippase MurJ [Candidatus Dojkabacteria bacterium]